MNNFVKTFCLKSIEEVRYFLIGPLKQKVIKNNIREWLLLKFNRQIYRDVSGRNFRFSKKEMHAVFIMALVIFHGKKTVDKRLDAKYLSILRYGFMSVLRRNSTLVMFL